MPNSDRLQYLAEECPVTVAEPEVEEAPLGLDYSGRLRWSSFVNRVLYLHEEITSAVVREKSMEIQALLRKSREPIVIMVSSPGGVVLPGLALYDEILEARDKGADVIMRVCGYAASMAAVVLQAASVREALTNSRILIHEVSRFTWWSEDKPSDLEEQLTEMKKLQGILMRIVSSRSGRSAEEWEKLIWKRDVWYSADEALTEKLIDRIVV
jgi:ATP-dependent Clp protease protease subunit